MACCFGFGFGSYRAISIAFSCVLLELVATVFTPASDGDVV